MTRLAPTWRDVAWLTAGGLLVLVGNVIGMLL